MRNHLFRVSAHHALRECGVWLHENQAFLDQAMRPDARDAIDVSRKDQVKVRARWQGFKKCSPRSQSELEHQVDTFGHAVEAAVGRFRSDRPHCSCATCPRAYRRLFCGCSCSIDVLNQVNTDFLGNFSQQGPACMCTILPLWNVGSSDERQVLPSSVLIWTLSAGAATCQSAVQHAKCYRR